MDILAVDLVTSCTSFREPPAQRYQRSLPLPPPTTIAGFFGAAMGLKRIDDVLKEAGVGVSLIDRKGKGKDFWKIQKTKGKRDVIFREFHYGSLYRLYLIGNANFIENAERCLKDPRFALTLGGSEDLVNVQDRSIRLYSSLSSEPIQTLKNTLIPKDVRGQYQLKAKVSSLSLREIAFNLTPPEFVSLPVRFRYEEKGRLPDRIETFTFLVELEIELKQPIDGYIIDGLPFIPCGPYHD
jgi:CRISPR-associated protein Cas5t